jgi:hypothetical protein
VFGSVLIVDLSDFNQGSRRVDLAGGRTGRCTKTLKMVKNVYVNLFHDWL